ncbi:AAA family ATPase [Vibrio cortegadensis]|uniref:McrB family protein n=1 Tax=Vibrio cortegadensis TaxID=1328770 RepID=UPI0021C38DB5|nr:AAA family ATPase [Vibrio cortegadensis]MDN3696180.1 AAA family ATPase [Vibrio cortegadensis]
MTKITVQRAIEIVKSQTYDDSQFYQFVEVEGHRLPAKRFYSALFDVLYQDINTHKAERELRKAGYEIISTRPTAELPTIWKVSHGPKFVYGSNKNWLLDNHYLAVHENTGNGGGENFLEKIQVGDIVSLGYGNSVAKLVIVTSDIIKDSNNPFESGWQLRKYAEIVSLSETKPYEGIDKIWSPRRPNTCAAVPKHDLNLFEAQILTEYYQMSLEELQTLYASFHDSEQPFKKTNKESVMNSPSLNQILYGPPGTGKTYHTIEAAVKAAEPEFYHNLGIDSASGATLEQRQALQTKFKELSDSKRIRFVTFHQSYGYEEFVEGLSASTTDNDQVKYAVKDGVFKEIADDARKNLEDSQRDQQSLDREQKFDLALEAFKLSIFEESDSFSLTDAVSIISIEEEGFRYCGEWKSSQIMKFVDLKSLYLAEVETRQDVKRVESVSGLAKQHATYFFKALKQIETFVSNELPPSQRLEKHNYVLVIDEINRGNISKIFGELITLIEPSKRKGSDEFIELTLPQSKKPFSVPNNLYLIGTMNTADRSLAMMDTALRRRFDFVEMMPKPSLLKDCVVKNGDVEINLSELLIKLNERIEILYDREHTLGHAFFMPVKALVDAGEQDKAFRSLVSVFKNKIIPLLEEYFFEDWSKIRLVLADNQKPEHLQFVEEKEQKAEALRSLFGKGHNLDQYGQSVVKYTLAADNAAVWNNVKAYIGVYQTNVKQSTQSSEVQAESGAE